MISLIVAYDARRCIGRAGDMPWGRALTGDLKHFRALTTGGTIIMGRKTFESIGRPLPDRQNIIVSRSGFTSDGCETAQSIDEAICLAKHPVWVIGGAEIYAAALPVVDTVHATEIAHDFGVEPGDVHFPELDALWHETSRQPGGDDSLYAYDFVVYERATPQSQL